MIKGNNITNYVQLFAIRNYLSVIMFFPIQMSSISLTAGDKSNVFSNVMLRFLAKVHRNNFAQHSIEDSKVFIISHYLHINFSQHRTTYWFLMIYFL